MEYGSLVTVTSNRKTWKLHNKQILSESQSLTSGSRLKKSKEGERDKGFNYPKLAIGLIQMLFE